MFFCRPGFDEAVICNGLPFFSRQSIIAAGFRIFARRPFVTVYFFRPWQALIMPVFLYFWIFSSETANFLTVLFLLAVKTTLEQIYQQIFISYRIYENFYEYFCDHETPADPLTCGKISGNLFLWPSGSEMRFAESKRRAEKRIRRPPDSKNAYSRVKKDAWSKIIKALTDQKRKTA